MSTNNHNLLIVSDLHLSEGRLPIEGKYSPLEDFFSDQAFADFLAYYQKQGGPPWKLVINGDTFDFLQVTAVPTETAADLANLLSQPSLPPLPTQVTIPPTGTDRTNLKTWLEQLKETIANLAASPQQASLQSCANQIDTKLQAAHISKNELWQLERYTLEALILACEPNATLSEQKRTYGLGTTWAETAWKLGRIVEGHPVFFRALFDFLTNDNSLLIILGNHDVELIWDEVQIYLCSLLLPENRCQPDANNKPIAIEPWYHLEDELVYIEHGNQYDGANAFERMDKAVLTNDRTEIDLPSGSLLVSYLFNKIEEAYPYADNLRPITRFFSWALQNQLVTLMIIMIWYVGPFLQFMSEFFLKDVWGTAKRFLFQREKQETTKPDFAKPYEAAIDAKAREIRKSLFDRLQTAVILILVGVLMGLIFIPTIYGLYTFAGDSSDLGSLLRSIGVSILGLLFNQTIAPRLLSYISGHNALEMAASDINNILQQHNKAVPYIIFGHNHEPDIIESEEAYWYINTGSWLYSQGTEEGWLQQKKYYSFLKIIRGPQTSYPELLRWDPELGRPTDLRLRLDAPEHPLVKRCTRAIKQFWEELSPIHLLIKIVAYPTLLILLLLIYLIAVVKEWILDPVFRWLVQFICFIIEIITKLFKWMNQLFRK
ncbi:MAG: hypothetical protein AAF614_24790 [Chloroflexota bacterium]